MNSHRFAGNTSGIEDIDVRVTGILDVIDDMRDSGSGGYRCSGNRDSECLEGPNDLEGFVRR